MSVAVIADIIGSRSLADRSAAQATFEQTIARVEHEQVAQGFPAPDAPLRPTVGDEMQARYATLNDALLSLLLVQLALPDGHELRFGVGVGPTQTLAGSAGTLHDGPGWWAARQAIDEVSARQVRVAPASRIRIVGGPREHKDMHSLIDVANAYVLVRDQLVVWMSERERRITYGRCLGRTQAQIAADEGISQSAVSQALSKAGASAIIEGLTQWGSPA